MRPIILCKIARHYQLHSSDLYLNWTSAKISRIHKLRQGKFLLVLVHSSRFQQLTRSEVQGWGATHRESSTSARLERTPQGATGTAARRGCRDGERRTQRRLTGLGRRSRGEIGSASMSRGKGEGASVVRAWIERSAARRSEQRLRGARAEGEEGDRRQWAPGWVSCATAVPPRRRDRGSGVGRLAWGDCGGGEAIRTNHKITSGSF